jgi:predicted metal-dependent enzyme (double-stranded beta helix superfamily)
MPYTLEEFSADCHRILKADPGAAGREQVRQKLENLLLEDDFVAANCGPDATDGANLLYEDSELGFHILAHIMEKGHAGGVHDHGAAWAIYGQAVGYTDMTEWTRTDDGTTEGKATVEKDRSYRLERGQAGIFQDHKIHSIAYPDNARFIRVTGVDLQTIPRGRYNVETSTMSIDMRPNFKGAA